MLTPEDIQIIKDLLKESFEIELKPIKQDILEIKKSVATLTDRVNELDNYKTHESRAIEYEITNRVKSSLNTRFEGFTITKFPLKRLFDPVTDNEITELDGAFLVSSKPTGTIPVKSYLIIIEAKHFITTDKIETKLLQIYNIHNYLNFAKNIKNPNKQVHVTPLFRKYVEQYNLDQINDIYLYIGGPVWDTDTVKFCTDLNSGKITHLRSKKVNDKIKKLKTNEKTIDIIRMSLLNYGKGHIAYIVPRGLDYVINDGTTEFLTGGNKNTKMIIMPNYINTIFT